MSGRFEFYMIHLVVIESIIGFVLTILFYYYGYSELLPTIALCTLFTILALFFGYIIYSNWKRVCDGMTPRHRPIHLHLSDTPISCDESECVMAWALGKDGTHITVYKKNIEDVDSYVHEFSEITIAKVANLEVEDCVWVANAMLDESYLEILMEEQR